MPTIFDFDPTDTELDALFGGREACEEAAGNRASPDGQIAAIVRLMSLRGKDAEASRYLELIKDPQTRFDTKYTLLLTA